MYKRQAVDKIVLLIGTNDIGKDMPLNEALNNLEVFIQSIARDYPLTEIKLLSILPVNEGEEYKQTVYIRSNEKIQNWNHAYQELASAYMQVEFVPVFDSLTDQAGQLKKEFTTDEMCIRDSLTFGHQKRAHYFTAIGPQSKTSLKSRL